MPSATMKSEPRGPIPCSWTCGCRLALPVLRSATRNVSSLWSRVRPRSVLPKTETRTESLATGSGRELSIDLVEQAPVGRRPEIDGALGPRPRLRPACILDVGIRHGRGRGGPQAVTHIGSHINRLRLPPGFVARGRIGERLDTRQPHARRRAVARLRDAGDRGMANGVGTGRRVLTDH